VVIAGWEVAEPLCHAPTIGHLGSVGPDGAPHVVPIWLDADRNAGELLLNTTDGTAKLGNLRREPRAMLSIHASDVPFLAVLLRVTLVGEIGGAAAAAHIDALSRSYDGTPWPFPEDEREHRVIVRLRVDRITVLT
jgi:PPOX class probable F420-dependent enzyme